MSLIEYKVDSVGTLNRGGGFLEINPTLIELFKTTNPTNGYMSSYFSLKNCRYIFIYIMVDQIGDDRTDYIPVEALPFGSATAKRIGIPYRPDLGASWWWCADVRPQIEDGGERMRVYLPYGLAKGNGGGTATLCVYGY